MPEPRVVEVTCFGCGYKWRVTRRRSAFMAGGGFHYHCTACDLSRSASAHFRAANRLLEQEARVRAKRKERHGKA